MSSTPFERYQCWNTERIEEVINREAISVDRATFMATHAPFRHISYIRSPHHMSDTSEENFLQELLTCAQHNRHMFSVIQGIPGTGKSHLIRWLKERYVAEMKNNGQDNEQVLLIERAQNSLVGTLRQIINSGIFDDERMQDHLAKLKGATDTLSERAMADNILNNLGVATYEVVLDDTERPKKSISARIERFLLDPVVREELKRSDGPVDRLVQFLSTGKSSRMASEELPGFQASDFEFSAETLHKIRHTGGYDETKYIAENLNQKEDFRESTARYLNRLLNYAIGRTTALSMEDLKKIFSDLRRYLRQKGYNLALFIEDITAFTGIDNALVDVLATQHTGESNQEFCRLISIVGITDSYFHSRFPDNIKERITYHLSLNAKTQAITERDKESDFLQDKDATKDLVARYLNAMRVSQEQLDDWLRCGGRPEDLPNLCTACVHKNLCHTAFDAALLSEEGEPEQMQVGLYPFNTQAIWTMYQRIDTTTTSRTPRSLLTSVLLYVMQSHAHLISQGNFPPPAKEMGSDFSSPTLQNPLQKPMIDEQGHSDSKRIESLVLFWGDRTIDAITYENGRFVGGLSEIVFKAFGVTIIEGNLVSPGKTLVAPPPKPPVSSETKPVDRFDKLPASKNITLPPPKPSEPILQPAPIQTSKYADDISKWLDGAKLQKYEDIRKFLFNYLLLAIDWEAHNVSRVQRDERFMAKRIEIEDQSGKMQVKDYLHFPRSQEFALVLHALADLNDSSLQLTHETIGGHLANLSAWLYHEEERIVAFVRQPNSTIGDHPSLTKLLIRDTLFIDWICGNLRVSSRSTQELLLHLVKSSKQKISQQEMNKLIEEASNTHGATWAKLLKRIKTDSINVCRDNMLQTLNCPQGGSKEVLYIDAATMLDVIRNIKKQDWVLPELDSELAGNVQEIWKDSIDVYLAFQTLLESVLQDEYQYIQGRMQTLQTYMGENTPKQVLQAIQGLLTAFSDHQRNYSFNTPRPSGEKKLETSLQYLQTILEETTPQKEKLLRLSGVADHIQRVQDFIAYFQNFMKEFQTHQEKLESRLATLRESDAAIEPLRQEVQKAYDQIVTDLHEIASPIGTDDKENEV